MDVCACFGIDEIEGCVLDQKCIWDIAKPFGNDGIEIAIGIIVQVDGMAEYAMHAAVKCLVAHELEKLRVT